MNSGDYTKLCEFIGDVMRIFENCRFFNQPNSSIMKNAESLETFFSQKLSQLRDRVAPWSWLSMLRSEEIGVKWKSHEKIWTIIFTKKKNVKLRTEEVKWTRSHEKIRTVIFTKKIARQSGTPWSVWDRRKVKWKSHEKMKIPFCWKKPIFFWD